MWLSSRAMFFVCSKPGFNPPVLDRGEGSERDKILKAWINYDATNFNNEELILVLRISL